MSLLAGALLGFALWTLAILVFTVGVHRWSLILTRRAQIHEFPAEGTTGPAWYQRSMRAHANCVENLPVFGALVVVAWSVDARGNLLDGLGLAVLGGRIAQSVTHIAFTQSAGVVAVRFSFFSVQLAAMVAMAMAIIFQ